MQVTNSSGADPSLDELNFPQRILSSEFPFALKETTSASFLSTLGETIPIADAARPFPPAPYQCQGLGVPVLTWA